LNLFLFHETAFADPGQIGIVRRTFEETYRNELFIIKVTSDDLTLSEAVDTYFFNSQLVSTAEGSMVLVSPWECSVHEKAKALIQRIIEQPNPIKDVVYVNIRQSMKNGGGPACLRLRIVLTQLEKNLSMPNFYFTNELYEKLTIWAERNYREELAPEDLSDPRLLQESRTALDELTQILDLGSIYDFQQNSD
jgi:succinylarginine dihydrolase